MAERKQNDNFYAKIPPQAPDVERTVLGSVLIDADALDTAVELLNEECFYATGHRLIFSLSG